MNEMALEQASLPSPIDFPSQMIIPPLLRTHLSLPLETCCRVDETAHYHKRSLKFGLSSPTWRLCDCNTVKFSLNGEV
jgi:hypothetical protein